VDRLPSLKVPTLVLRGEHDPLVGSEATDELAAAIAGSESATVAEAGHLVNLDQPGRFDAVVLDFLERNRCPRP
jgi:pimeloyl-ACP methyl ester carboxylesterase